MLLGNIGFLTISNLATKLISFLLVPLYTSILTTDEFGVYDLITSSVALCIPVITLCIREGILRFSLDDDVDKKAILFSALKIFLIGYTVLTFIMIVNHVYMFNEIFDQHRYSFLGLYCVNALVSLLSYFARGLNCVKIISIGNVIALTISISLNVVFLVYFKWGLAGYFAATIIGQLVLVLYLIFALKIWKYISLSSYDKKLEKDMLKYSIPMIANTVAWWLNTSADKYALTFMCGVGINGLYAVAHKIPSLVATFQNIFSQAWSISAVKDMDASDSSGFYSKTYQIYNIFLILITSGSIVFDKLISSLLLANNFYNAWKFAPLLMISALFSGLCGFLNGILAALKKTDVISKIATFAAVINIVFNIIFIKMFGPLGAPLSTVMGFMIMWILTLFNLRQFVSIRVNLLKDSIGYSFLGVQALLLLLIDVEKMFSFVQFVLFACIALLYNKEIKSYIKSALSAIKHK